MHTETRLLTIKREANVVTVTLNRPAVRNALNPEMIQQLTSELVQISTDVGVRMVILRGAGDHFCAGADITWLQASTKYPDAQNLREAQLFATLMHTLNTLNKITLCVAQGSVFGGGIGLVACCDIAICDANAIFCFAELKLGLSPAIISPYIVNTIGNKAARRWILTAEQFTGQTAEHIGLVHKIFTDLAEADNIVQHFIELTSVTGPVALQVTKNLLNSKLDCINEATDLRTTQLLTELRGSEEGQEGLAAFLDKRQPNWR